MKKKIRLKYLAVASRANFKLKRTDKRKSSLGLRVRDILYCDFVFCFIVFLKNNNINRQSKSLLVLMSLVNRHSPANEKGTNR